MFDPKWLTDEVMLDLRREYSLSPAQGNVLKLLLTNSIVTNKMLVGIYTSDIGVCRLRLRRKLSDAGLTLMTKRRLGMWLIPADVIKVAKEIGEMKKQLNLPLMK